MTGATADLDGYKDDWQPFRAIAAGWVVVKWSSPGSVAHSQRLDTVSVDKTESWRRKVPKKQRAHQGRECGGGMITYHAKPGFGTQCGSYPAGSCGCEVRLRNDRDPRAWLSCFAIFLMASTLPRIIIPYLLDPVDFMKSHLMIASTSSMKTLQRLPTFAVPSCRKRHFASTWRLAKCRSKWYFLPCRLLAFLFRRQQLREPELGL